jgi:DNA mismatch endonuclease (patch repair protein)
MVDTLTREQRSERMSRIRGRNTGPEWMVRRLIHGMGYRYRLHRKDLPGKPDLVFPRARKAIFIHGCFWHRHPAPACKLARLPKSRLEFWLPKLESNRERDKMNEEKLKLSGWKILVVWECETGNIQEVKQKIRNFLD